MILHCWLLVERHRWLLVKRQHLI